MSLARAGDLRLRLSGERTVSHRPLVQAHRTRLSTELAGVTTSGLQLRGVPVVFVDLGRCAWAVQYRVPAWTITFWSTQTGFCRPCLVIGSLSVTAATALRPARTPPRCLPARCCCRDATTKRNDSSTRPVPEPRPTAAQLKLAGAQCSRPCTGRGQADDAIALATHASRLLRPTDLLPLQADVLIDLASELAAPGDRASAIQAAERALALYTEKGNTVAAQHAGTLVTDAARPSGAGVSRRARSCGGSRSPRALP
jgi:hypothetical protein